MWVAAQDLPRSAGHQFYIRLNQILDEADFDGYVESLCQRFYADVWAGRADGSRGPPHLIWALLHEGPARVGRRGPHFSGPSAGATLQG